MKGMRIKYMIHRSKNPFLREKVLYRSAVAYYQARFPDLVFIDKGVRFSVRWKDLIIDFDYGYYRMRERKWGNYDLIVSTGLFAVFSSSIHPGDLVFPGQSRSMRITGKRVVIEDDMVRIDNPMSHIWKNLLRFEKGEDREKIEGAIVRALPYVLPSRKSLAALHARGARMVTANALFIPSGLMDHCWCERKDGQMHSITDTQRFLEKHFDGLNCESQDMMRLFGNKAIFWSVGLDKPYHVAELSKELRDEKNYQKFLPTFDLGLVCYFKFVFFGYLLSKRFRV
jgi:hypothetical protein